MITINHAAIAKLMGGAEVKFSVDAKTPADWAKFICNLVALHPETPGTKWEIIEMIIEAGCTAGYLTGLKMAVAKFERNRRIVLDNIDRDQSPDLEELLRQEVKGLNCTIGVLKDMIEEGPPKD